MAPVGCAILDQKRELRRGFSEDPGSGLGKYGFRAGDPYFFVLDADLPHRQPRIGLLQLRRAVVKLVSKQDRHLLNLLRCDARFAAGDALLQLGNRLIMFTASSTNYSSRIQLAGKSATVVIRLFD